MKHFGIEFVLSIVTVSSHPNSVAQGRTTQTKLDDVKDDSGTLTM